MPSFKVIGLLVLEKTILKVFTIYGHGGHLGHVTQMSWSCDLDHLYITFLSHFPRRLHMKFGIDWPSGFRKEDV